ncbi:MAG: anhydro-N-acetylmuramic acid kinase [Bacteroidota bacterium]|nr:anhydro-N-acetylmuramic acid kinase [Bacteroidota bacterium]
METLEKLFKKKKKLVVGLMSGTSADGIDAVVVEIKGSGDRTKIRQLAFETYSYPKGFREFLFKNSNSETARLDDITRLDMLLAVFFSEAAKKIARKAGMNISHVDLIGSHGQTIHHLPIPISMFGKSIRSTMQIGNPSAIAKLTGVVTVGDFRSGDVALGGSGAPLVPIFDYLVLRSTTVNRAALNIGGIANITILPQNCSIKQVVAFDTGPGNMIIDNLMQQYYNLPFDRDGKIASNGKINPSLLTWLLKHPYLKIEPPKSTGREMFGEDFIQSIISKTRGKINQDLITTISEFTALSIYLSYLRFVQRKIKIQELLVSGGGAHNYYIMEALKRYFSGIKVIPIDEINICSDAKEAICFAFLANETISGNYGNVPNATGAKRQTVLGTICLP